MKVLHVVHGSPHLDPGAGGTERYAAAVAHAQGAPLLTRDPTRSDTTLQRGPVNGLWTVGLPVPTEFRGTWSNPIADAALAAVLDHESPDVVHIHHLAHLGFGLVHVAREAGIAVVLTLHDYHLVCGRGQLVNRDLRRCSGPSLDRCGDCLSEHLRATPRLMKLGKLAGELGLHGHGRTALARLSPGPQEKDKIQARLEAGRLALRSADRVLSPSRHLGMRLE
jgi:hypothetical protein